MWFYMSNINNIHALIIADLLFFISSEHSGNTFEHIGKPKKHTIAKFANIRNMR